MSLDLGNIANKQIPSINLSFLGADFILPLFYLAVRDGSPRTAFTLLARLSAFGFRQMPPKKLKKFPETLDKCSVICYNGLNRKGKGKADFPDKEIVGYGM